MDIIQMHWFLFRCTGSYSDALVPIQMHRFLFRCTGSYSDALVPLSLHSVWNVYYSAVSFSVGETHYLCVRPMFPSLCTFLVTDVTRISASKLIIVYNECMLTFSLSEEHLVRLRRLLLLFPRISYIFLTKENTVCPAWVFVSGRYRRDRHY